MRRPGVTLALLAACAVCASVASARPAPPGGTSPVRWRALHGDIKKSIKKYRGLLNRPPRDPARVEVVGRVDAMLEKALCADVTEPGIVLRIATFLDLVGSVVPEQQPDLHRVLSDRVGLAVQGLRGADLEEFVRLAKKIWGGRNRQAADRNVVPRMILASRLANLLGRTDRKDRIMELITELLRREVAWIPTLAVKPQTLARAVKLLGSRPESPTVYPLLDAVEVVHEVVLDFGDPGVFLEPLVTELIACLGKVEIRVRGHRPREVLDIENDGSTSQFRIWFRSTDILQRWTAQTEYVWHAQWDGFWKLYHGEEKVQEKFDFRDARNRGLGIAGQGCGTRVGGERKRARFFGIEHQSAKFLIILDVSGSMEENSENVNRLDGLKREAIRFIESLKPGVHYNVLPFSGTCAIGQSLSRSHALVPKRASRGKLSQGTRDWINNLTSGGKTRADLAFRAAFGVDEGGAGQPGGGGFRPEFREIYFITDGVPTNKAGKPLKARQIADLLDTIRGFNARHRVIVHSIGFSGMVSPFVQNLARQNGGVLKIIRREELAP